MTLNKILLALLLFSGFSIFAKTEARIEAARDHVARNALFTESRDGGSEPVLAIGRDPETSVTSFVHAIRRNAKKLLSAEQAKRWEALLADRQSLLKGLHDERNVLRAYFFACAWEAPAYEPGLVRTAKEKELRDWLDVWMEIRLQEQIAHHRYCRDAWALLTEAQREQLKRGDWDKFVKKSTGHKRTYFGDRVVRRALGEPTKVDAFKLRSAQFEKEHTGIQKALLVAESRWRRAKFAMPSLPDEVMAQAWRPVDDAYRAFFLSQARHIDELSRAGYDLDDVKLRERLAARPGRELAELDQKIESKLASGRKLRSLIQNSDKNR